MIEIAEACDDGNKINGDGCNSFCVVENNYKCVGEFGQRSTCSIKTIMSSRSSMWKWKMAP